MKKIASILLLACTHFAYAQTGPTDCDHLPPNPGKQTDTARFLVLPILNSNTIGNPTILLDFDGETTVNGNWNGGNPIISAPADMSEAKIIETHTRVADFHRWNNINVTTSEAAYLAAPSDKRIRVIITPSNGWRPNVGGIAWVDSWIYGDNTPVFVFSNMLYNMPRYVAECATHESGHALGLTHQVTWDPVTCQLINSYAMGSGNGTFGWAPVMGNSYYQIQTLFSNGTTGYGCTVTADEIAIITRPINGVVFRPRTGGGYLQLNPGNTTLTLTIHPYRTDSFRLQTNQHVLVKIKTISPKVDTKIRFNGVEGNPADSLNASVQTVLTEHNTWLEIMGVDNQFSPDYGNTGEVTVTIEVIPLNILPVINTPQTQPIRHPFFRHDQQNIYIRSSRYATYNLFNSIGQMISKGAYIPGPNTISISHLPKGLYILTTEFSNHKIIKL